MKVLHRLDPSRGETLEASLGYRGGRVQVRTFSRRYSSSRNPYAPVLADHAALVLGLVTVVSSATHTTPRRAETVALSACSRGASTHAWAVRGRGRPAPPERGKDALRPRPIFQSVGVSPAPGRERDLVIMARSARLSPGASPADSGHGPAGKGRLSPRRSTMAFTATVEVRPRPPRKGCRTPASKPPCPFLAFLSLPVPGRFFENRPLPDPGSQGIRPAQGSSCRPEYASYPVSVG
jgi:hypothetical protein